LSISTTTRKAGPFVGNDIQTVFPFTFKVFTTADVVVTRSVSATGVETVLALATDYTVALNADQDNAPGGSVTLLAALALAQNLAITSAVAALQPVAVTNGGGFFASVFNGVFDRLTILVQQLIEQVGRTMTIPVTATGVASLKVPVVASAVLQWSADGTQLTAVLLPDLSLSLALPAQGGHANHPLFSNGASPLWRAIALSDVTGLTGNLNYLNAAMAAAPTMAQLQARDAAQKAVNDFLFSAAIIF
jgi:hypothetical protein